MFVEINTDKIKYTGMVCFVTGMKALIVMRREVTGLSDIWHGILLWTIVNKAQIMSRKLRRLFAYQLVINLVSAFRCPMA